MTSWQALDDELRAEAARGVPPPPPRLPKGWAEWELLSYSSYSSSSSSFSLSFSFSSSFCPLQGYTSDESGRHQQPRRRERSGRGERVSWA